MNAPQDRGLSVEHLQTGKLGIALSGGGFRAALFHVGVLARLAQRDLLRKVALISTVSGGSIIGAFYYLKVKQLLEGRRADGLLPSTRSYCELVAEIEREFLAALQQNIRLMTFADSRENSRMLAGQSSRTQRVGKLLDSCFFAPITGTADNRLRNIPIHSAGTPPAADTEQANDHFVTPQLILNATALNTGHLFQLSGNFVGEPSISSVPGGTTEMPRLHRLHMDDPKLTATQRARLDRITLGEAVAASCCVPGLLDPLALDGLYQDDDGRPVRLRLVDGGVFDNQGLVTLFEEHCTHVICSDASERLHWQPEPEDLIHSVALRANDILMDRIRKEVTRKLRQRDPECIEVIRLGDPAGSEFLADDAPRFLRSLKSIRTDLDAFSDIEAWSLMYHGYLASKRPVAADRQSGPDAEVDSNTRWTFAGLRPLIEDKRERERVLRYLDVGSRQFLKVFYLGKPLPWIIAVLPTVVPITLSIVLIHLLPPIPTSIWVVLGIVALCIVAYSQNARITRWLDQVDSIRRWRRKLVIALRPLGITVMLGTTGALASRITLQVFNPLFLRYGRLDKREK